MTAHTTNFGGKDLLGKPLMKIRLEPRTEEI